MCIVVNYWNCLFRFENSAEPPCLTDQSRTDCEPDDLTFQQSDRDHVADHMIDGASSNDKQTIIDYNHPRYASICSWTTNPNHIISFSDWLLNFLLTAATASLGLQLFGVFFYICDRCNVVA